MNKLQLIVKNVSYGIKFVSKPGVFKLQAQIKLTIVPGVFEI